MAGNVRYPSPVLKIKGVEAELGQYQLILYDKFLRKMREEKRCQQSGGTRPLVRVFTATAPRLAAA